MSALLAEAQAGAHDQALLSTAHRWLEALRRRGQLPVSNRWLSLGQRPGGA